MLPVQTSWISGCSPGGANAKLVVYSTMGSDSQQLCNVNGGSLVAVGFAGVMNQWRWKWCKACYNPPV